MTASAPLRVATIDIGTNTVLLLVAERDAEGRLVPVEEHATITRLGEGVDERRVLLPEAIARTNACLDRYAEIVRRTNAERVAVVGTSAMRDAGGGDAVRAHVKARFGVEARTISGDEEATLTFAGALSGLDVDRSVETLVFDIGGGSTEVVLGVPSSAGPPRFAQSFDVGSVRLTERHVRTDPPTARELDDVRLAAASAFASVPAPAGGATVSLPIGIAGTMTTLAAVALELATYDATHVHGMVLARPRLEALVTRLASMPLAERRSVPGLEPKRADVIVAGALVALALLDRLGALEVRISDRGVRWGLAEQLARAS